MECQTLKRYNESSQPIYKKKVPYNTMADAIKAAKNINSRDHVIHKVVAYKCSKCYKFHVGRNGKELKDKERNKLKLQLKWKV